MKTGVGVVHCSLDGLLQVVLSLLQPENVRKNLLQRILTKTDKQKTCLLDFEYQIMELWENLDLY